MKLYGDMVYLLIVCLSLVIRQVDGDDEDGPSDDDDASQYHQQQQQQQQSSGSAVGRQQWINRERLLRYFKINFGRFYSLLD